MNRDHLRHLTVPLASVAVLVACLVCLVQIPALLLALAAEVADALVRRGTRVLAYLTGQPIVTATIRPHYHPGGVR